MTCGQVWRPSAFNPSKCTHTVVSSEQTNTHTHTHTHSVNTHPEQWAANAAAPGNSWGFGALLKDLTSVMVLRWRERWTSTYNPCWTGDPNPQPLGYKSDSLSIRPRLPLIWKPFTRTGTWTLDPQIKSLMWCSTDWAIRALIPGSFPLRS